MCLTQTAPTDYEKLWKPDVLGLPDKPSADQSDVYKEFKEQLTRSRKVWYKTGLPWRGDHPSLPNNKTGSLKCLDSTIRKLEKKGMLEQYDHQRSACREHSRTSGRTRCGVRVLYSPQPCDQEERWKYQALHCPRCFSSSPRQGTFTEWLPPRRSTFAKSTMGSTGTSAISFNSYNRRHEASLFTS